LKPQCIFAYIIFTLVSFLSLPSPAEVLVPAVPVDPALRLASPEPEWTNCKPEELAVFPKYMKVKTSSSSTRLLLKVSQAKNSFPESCITSKTSEGWKQYQFRFSLKFPVQVKVHTSSLGSLLWKLERTFQITEALLVAKQPGKAIYQMSLTDPATQLVYDFQIDLLTKSVRVRTKN